MGIAVSHHPRRETPMKLVKKIFSGSKSDRLISWEKM
jgi:hypothetical protein